MNRWIFAIMLTLIGCVLLCGCTSQTGQAPNEKKNPESPSIPEKPSEKIPEVIPPGGTGTGSLMEPTMNTTDTRNMVSQETMALNSTRDIYLKENPTTGYGWNATITAGLVIETDDYVADPVKPGIVGSGGMHHWVIRGLQKGHQTFEAIYMRSWEPITGNEDRYTMNILIE